jgi:hypothetical protein
MLCPGCSPEQSFTYALSVNAQKVLRLLQTGGFDSVSRVKVEPELARELELVISGYIKYLLEKELKSVAWLETLRKQHLQSPS